MLNWSKPVAVSYDLLDISKEVKAKAWSPDPMDPGYNINSYLDDAYEGYEAWFYDDDYGVQVSAKCIGSVWLGLYYMKTLLFSDGSTRVYFGVDGNWWQ